MLLPHALFSRAFFLQFLIFFPTIPPTHQPFSTDSLREPPYGLMVTASIAPPPLSNSHAVLWLSSAPAQHHPIPGTHICLLLSLFDSDQPPIKVAGYCQENRGKELTLSPHLAFPLPGFPFLFAHLPSLHHRFCVLTCPNLFFSPLQEAAVQSFS